MATETSRNLNVVGQFIRQKREAAGLSQRALGQLFDPPVTTQFISNIERGVTPLPPAHISTLTRALKISEEELMHTLEREYSLKISHRVGRPELAMTEGAVVPGQFARSPGASDDSSIFEAADRPFFTKLYSAYRNADPATKENFRSMAERTLNLSGGQVKGPQTTNLPNNSLTQ